MNVIDDIYRAAGLSVRDQDRQVGDWLDAAAPPDRPPDARTCAVPGWLT